MRCPLAFVMLEDIHSRQAPHDFEMKWGAKMSDWRLEEKLLGRTLTGDGGCWSFGKTPEWDCLGPWCGGTVLELWQEARIAS